MVDMTDSTGEPNSSGSRWEPDQSDQPTEILTPWQPASDPEPTPKRARRRLPTAAAVILALLLGGLGGTAFGLAVAGQRTEQSAETVDPGVSVDSASPEASPDATDPGAPTPVDQQESDGQYRADTQAPEYDDDFDGHDDGFDGDDHFDDDDYR